MSDLFSNPVLAGNFPDPGVLAQDGVWHAYGTNNAAANVPPLTSSDLVHWSEAGDVLPVLGSWPCRAGPGRPRCCIRLRAGTCVYYTARSELRRQQCIGVAARGFSTTRGYPGRSAARARDANSGLTGMDWVDGRPVVRGPTAGPQPMPA